MKLKYLAALTLLSAAFAQQPQDDPFKDYLFPPDLVMQNQQALALTNEQKVYMQAELLHAQQRFTELQWKLQDEVERLTLLLKERTVDEQKALAQLEKVLAAEHDIKHTQMTLLIRIKNHLKPEQQARLQEIQNKARGR
jgi:Spy/CpxP family protein refolding chaperone